jgi:hypothetical protein
LVCFNSLSSVHWYVLIWKRDAEHAWKYCISIFWVVGWSNIMITISTINVDFFIPAFSWSQASSIGFFSRKSLRKIGVIYQNWLVTDGRPILEHIQHNHSYHLPPESAGALQRPVTRDKQKGKISELLILKWHSPIRSSGQGQWK